MTNLALASRRFLPFVRPRLLETVDLSSASKIEEVIRWLEAVTPEERLVIRHLHIVGVNLELGKSGDNITQQRLAHLLWLLPGIRTLSIALWSSSQLQPALKLALGRLASLDSFSFHSKNKSPPAFAILASLPSLRLDRLVLKLHYFDGENAVSFPATLAPRHLDAGVWTGGGLSNQLARGSLVSVGARLAALEVPSRYLSPSILASLAPTLRALALDWTIAGKTLDVVLPRLEVVALDGSMELNRRFSSNRRDIDQPIHSIPLLRHVATLAWDETPPATQVMQLFLAGHQHLRRLLYGEAWRRNDASMAALRAAMPGTEVVSVSRSGQLDLSALLDTGEYVQRNTSYHFQ